MIIAVLQARMSSQRLPGKVLRPLCGVPMLLYQYRRVLDAQLLDAVIVATSMDKSDDPIREMCAQNRIVCFSGSLNDVLDRFYWLAQIFRPHHIVRLTGDCPLIDPEIIDETVKVHLAGGYDYTHATMDCGWPDGYDTEVFTFQALCQTWKGAGLDGEREHVTPYLRTHPELFRIGECRNDHDQSSIKISVDTEEDFQRVERLLNAVQRI
jgi:spore coat polysaccharide biosynthesis protein SpsF